MKGELIFMPFCDTLRTLIDERGLTQKQLAQDLEIPVSTLGGYVQGTSEPDFETLKLFANYFNVSADYLLNLKIGNTQSRLENELLRIFRSLSTEQQELYLEQGKAFIRINAKEDVKSSESTLQGKNNVG
jgi:transcriptional regulator with XRE-family HTH domain